MNSDSRKGELAEMKLQLGQLAGSRAPGANEVRRELFKKVISFMTVGIDVSALFTEMVMCAATSDVVLKKMCYLYMATYAVTKPELALLTINFLQKDCQDDDPMVRGLALRSLTSLRVRHLVEYLTSPLMAGLADASSYVRSNAVVGVLKLYHLAPSVCHDHSFVPLVRRKLVEDPDPQVVSNCLNALQEIYTSEAHKGDGEAVRDLEDLHSKPVVFALLNRLKEMSEWSQCSVLELVSKYTPADEDEVFDLMNLLEDRLQHANSAVVLATARVFLHLTLSMPDVHLQVYERIKSPLLTLVGTAIPEVSAAVVHHLALLVSRNPSLFVGDYKHFFCRVTDPPAVKRLKLQMLTAIANASNTHDIVTELTEYVADVDVTLAREAIRAVGQIALESNDVNAIVDRLLQFLEMDTDYVTAETLVLVRDLLRKFPQWSQDCIAVVGSVGSKSVSDTRAKSALVWMLGEYGQHMSDAPYVMEGLVAGWEEEPSVEVRLELLTAAAKLFFQRPPECQKLLGQVLSLGLAESHQDIHDRALLYYRLLKAGVETARKVICPEKQPVSVFVDAQAAETKDRIFDEFNSLSVVYRKPAYQFLDKEHRGLLEAEYVATAATAAATQSANSSSSTAPASAAAAGAAAARDQEVHASLLDDSDRHLAGTPPLGGHAAAHSASTNGTASGTADLLSSFDLLSDHALVPAGSAGAAAAVASDPLIGSSAPAAASSTAPAAAAAASAASHAVDPFGGIPGLSDLSSPAASAAAPAPATATATAGSTAAGAVRGMTSIDDLLGGGSSSTSVSGGVAVGGGTDALSSLLSGTPTPAMAPVPAPAPAAPVTSFSLAPKASLSAGAFQSKWGQLPLQATVNEPLPSHFTSALTSAPLLLRHMAQRNVQCMASGGKAPNFKFFFYALSATSPGVYFLVELVINTTTANATAKVKADQGGSVDSFIPVLKTALLSFGQL